MTGEINIKKGLDIPLSGIAEKILVTLPGSSSYGVCPPDFYGAVPKMIVKSGDRVKAGSPLFYDKYNEKILYTSPVSGIVKDIVRGDKRRIMQVIIEPDGSNEYENFGPADPQAIDREKILKKILNSGLWPVMRQRPYSIVANPDQKPKAIFVSAFNSAPLAPDMDFIIQGQESIFQTGLNVLRKLTDGKVHLSTHTEKNISRGFLDAQGVELHRFYGPHPSGNVGVQIHHIDPINKGDVVWYAGVQHVIMLGRLFEQGIYDATKIIALTGSEVLKPRYYRITSGASISDIVAPNIRQEEGLSTRIISGDVLTGTKATTSDYIGFYDDHITVIPEGDKPELLSWIMPNFDKFSISRTFPSFLFPEKKYRLNTNLRSGERAFVISGVYEKVLPMDILPVQLIKSIMINDIDMMEKLGIYEVSPEDLALCEYVCPSKIEFQAYIKEGLEAIRREFS